MLDQLRLPILGYACKECKRRRINPFMWGQEKRVMFHPRARNRWVVHNGSWLARSRCSLPASHAIAVPLFSERMVTVVRVRLPSSPQECPMDPATDLSRVIYPIGVTVQPLRDHHARQVGEHLVIVIISHLV